MADKKNPLLEPTGMPSMLIVNKSRGDNEPPKTKPDFSAFPKPSDALSRVKSFMPQLQKADQELKNKIANGDNVNMEDVQDGEQFIEMNLGLVQKQNDDEDWSADSDPDSPPSPAERDNAFTSDSDSSSASSSSRSSSSSSASSSSRSSPRRSRSPRPQLKLPNNSVAAKRPIIEELDDTDN